MEIVKIDKYDTAYENGRVNYYAIAGKKRYPMPDCYKEMYNDKYLAITKRTLAMSEIYGVEAEHYIPLYTGE